MKKHTETKYVAYNPTTGEYHSSAAGWGKTSLNLKNAYLGTYGTARRKCENYERLHYDGKRPTEGEWEVRKVTVTISVGTEPVEDESGQAPWQAAKATIAQWDRDFRAERKARKAERKAELQSELRKLR